MSRSPKERFRRCHPSASPTRGQCRSAQLLRRRKHPGSGGSSSLQEVNQALTEDGEDADEGFESFLTGRSWDDSAVDEGALIGTRFIWLRLPCPPRRDRRASRRQAS